ncbi:MAG TPA: hypothetical protein VNJ02_16285 [Vicinamibacterales bacterium]|nr:hypothetical protein [Vicinamibacterales bacterium]
MSLIAAAFIFAIALQGNGLPFGQPPRTRVVRHGDDRLVGITTVDLVVAPLSAAAARCDLHHARLAADGLAGLTQPSLKVTLSAKDSSWFYTVFVSATTVLVEGRCVTTVTSRLAAQVDGMPEADQIAPAGAWGSLLVGRLPLIEQSSTVVGPASSHVRDVLAALRQQLLLIGCRITRANLRR